MSLPLTFHQFIEMNETEDATGVFSSIMNDISLACRITASKLRYGNIEGLMNKGKSLNESGDQQVPMDILANDIFVDVARNNKHISAVVSEEMNEILYIDECIDHKYILVIDPLDGSSNLAINGPVATIFSVCRINGERPSEQEVMTSAMKPVAAGICLYGLSTFLMYTTGDNLHGFTQNLEAGSFFLTHKDIRMPETPKDIAINYSHKNLWDDATKRYIEECFQGENGPRQQYFNTRWYASAAAELNRIVLKGGVFIYPACGESKPKGVLRKVYEAYPMAFIIEAAGGHATDGKQRMLDVPATTLHEKTPFYMGPSKEIELIKSYYEV